MYIWGWGTVPAPLSADPLLPSDQAIANRRETKESNDSDATCAGLAWVPGRGAEAAGALTPEPYGPPELAEVFWRVKGDADSPSA